MNQRGRSESLGRMEDEIRAEMAAALGRISSMFQALIAQLNDLEIKMRDQPDIETEEKYREILKEARLYYWYLMVQRESIGLRDHSQIPKEYSVPASVLQR